MAKLGEHNRVAQVKIGGRGVKAKLDAKWRLRGMGAQKLVLELAFNKNLLTASANESHRLLKLGRQAGHHGGAVQAALSF